MAQIILITELRNTGEVSALCSTTNEPVLSLKMAMEIVRKFYTRQKYTQYVE